MGIEKLGFNLRTAEEYAVLDLQDIEKDAVHDFCELIDKYTGKFHQKIMAICEESGQVKNINYEDIDDGDDIDRAEFVIDCGRIERALQMETDIQGYLKVIFVLFFKIKKIGGRLDKSIRVNNDNIYRVVEYLLFSLNYYYGKEKLESEVEEALLNLSDNKQEFMEFLSECFKSKCIDILQ